MNTANTTTQRVDVQRPSTLMSMAPLILIFVFMYFLVLRPQKKQEAARKDMRAKLKKGDTIVLRSGIICTFDKQISEEEVYVLVAEGIRLKVLRQTIDSVYQSSAKNSAHTDQKSHVKTHKKRKDSSDDVNTISKENDKADIQNIADEVEHDSEV